MSNNSFTKPTRRSVLSAIAGGTAMAGLGGNAAVAGPNRNIGMDNGISVDEVDILGDEIEVQVGSRTITTNRYTVDGTPVVPMWEAPLPSSMDREFLRTGAGFPVLAADEAWVWRPQSYDEGTYNHYACLIHHKGKFYAMWGNHEFGEDNPGQRVLYSVGDTWDNWSEREELFPPPGPVEETGGGIHLKPDRWAVIDDQLYAIVYVHGNGIYPIARLVAEDGTFGDPFLVRRVPGSGGLPEYMEEDVDPYVDPLNPPPIAARILQWYRDNDLISWWGRNGWNVPNFGVDHSELIENFIYPSPTQDGEQVLMIRSQGTPTNRPIHSNRIYVTFRGSESEGWADPYPTNIPDSPSRTQAITLDDGTVLLIGNQNVNRFDDALYILRDPLTVAVSSDGLTFDRIYALRTGSTEDYRFPDVTGRNPGFAYSSSIIHDGYLYTLYSQHKEDMGISRVPLSSLGV